MSWDYKDNWYPEEFEVLFETPKIQLVKVVGEYNTHYGLRFKTGKVQRISSRFADLFLAILESKK